MNHILVLGLGKFGRRLVDELSSRNGVRVFGVDRVEATCRNASDSIWECLTARVDSQAAVEAILDRIGNMDTAVVCLGGSTHAATLAALTLRERGIARIFIKAEDEAHRSVLEAMDRGFPGPPRFRLLIPESDAATLNASRIANDALREFARLGSDLDVAELDCPASLAGRSLAEMKVRERWGLTVLGWREIPEGPLHFADATTPLPEGGTLIVAGPPDVVRNWGEEAAKA